MSTGAPTPAPNPFGAGGFDPDTIDPESALIYETETQICRRSFAYGQAYCASFLGVVETYSNININWHDTNVDLNQGSFAVVQSGGALEDLVGEIIRVTVGTRKVYAYVVAESSIIQTPLTLAQRPFMAVGLLAQPLTGIVAQKIEVLE